MRMPPNALSLVQIACWLALVGCGGGGGSSVLPTPQAPAAFVLASPADGTAGADRQPTLEWQASAGAGAYAIVVDDTADLSSPVEEQVGIIETSFRVTVLLAASTTYYWRVTATNEVGDTSCTADFSFTTGLAAPPTVVEPPRSMTVAANNPVELSVGATGLSPMSYQWQSHDGTVWSDIVDAVGRTYTIGSIASTDDGLRLRCRVTNADGEALSAEATLTVRRVLMVRAGAAGASDGSSWADAHGQLQAALAAAATGVDEIWVAAGTYTPGTARSDTFQLVAGVTLVGGFAGDETAREDRNPAVNETVLSGEIGAEGRAYSVVRATAAGGLDGFTVSGGNADDMMSKCYGGGMYVANASPSVLNCRFIGNYGFYGGGMYVYGGSPTVINCVFSGNSGAYGGGLHCYGATAAPNVVNCTFSGNSSVNGGGSYNNSSSAPVLTNSVIWGNTASGGGASIYNLNGGAPVVTYSCIQGGYAGEGNLSSDPVFVDSAVPGDLRLQTSSPCIDAANGAVAPPLDILGSPRWDDPAREPTGTEPPPPDMGAFENLGF